MVLHDPSKYYSYFKAEVWDTLNRTIVRRWREIIYHFTKALPHMGLRELVLRDTDKCLVLAPHADDESIALGGLMLKHPKAFDVICVTNCATGNPKRGFNETIQERRLEFEAAMKFVEINRFQYNLSITSDNLENSYTKFESLLRTIDFNDYMHVFLPHHFDQHQDHMAITRLFRKYCKNHRLDSCISIILFEVWTPMTMPNRYVDISDVMGEKMRLINMYASQTQVIDYANRIQGLNRYRGMIPHVDYAECFQQMNVKEFMEISP